MAFSTMFHSWDESLFRATDVTVTKEVVTILTIKWGLNGKLNSNEDCITVHHPVTV
jgi:hypothetical protein